MQPPQALGLQIRREDADAGDIAARPVDAGNEVHLDRIRAPGLCQSQPTRPSPRDRERQSPPLAGRQDQWRAREGDRTGQPRTDIQW
jgi:hypothetical protein